METAELLKLIGDFGVGLVCLATLISLHVYNVKVTLPKIAEDSQKQQNLQLEAFREELKAEREQCHADNMRLFQMVAQCQESLARLLERKG